MMSETKLQGEMKPEGGSSEPSTTPELLQRLRELEAENLALAQANENQRETYERCLDEVANHVVQALLNQKDLREECIKLKKRVFDLERQNQALSDLFHQKLTSGSLSQLSSHPTSLLLDPSSQPGMVEKLPAAFPLGRCILQREVISEEQYVGTPGPSPQALEALSPFLRKKAQILEVLRSLEEMDPLLAFPSPWRDPGQPGSPEGVTAEAWPCLLLAQGEGLPRQRPLKGEGSSSSSSDEAGEADPPEKGHPGQVLLSALAERKLDLGDVETYLQQVLREAGDSALLNGEPSGPCLMDGSESQVSSYKHIQAVSCLEALGPPSACRETAYLSVLAPGEGKDKSRPGPPIPSPSKVLKLLKMPPPPSPAALRLSPQLTRSSKIPCRSNTYEVYHSPTPSRKGSPDSPFPTDSSLAGGHPSPKAGRHLAPLPPKVTPTSPDPFSYHKPHDYENILELSLSSAIGSHPHSPRDTKLDGSEALPPACRSAPPRVVPASEVSLEPCPFVGGREKAGPESKYSPPLIRRNTDNSKRAGNGPSKRTPEVANMPFKERLTVLGRLKGTEGKESASFEKGRAPARPCERPEGLGEAHPRLGTGSSSLKHQEPCHGSEPAPRCYSSHSVGSRGNDPEHHISKSRLLGTPATRNPTKPPPPGKHAKSPHGSPTKLPSKSPTKPPAQEPKPCLPPAKTPTSAGRKNPPCLDPTKGKAGPPASIEEKVMKGIEENVLRRHKGGLAAGEAKQKNSSSLASWFGLRKSKLPALSRRPEAPKGKEGKLVSRRLEAESLNISKLMEKAEDLRKALEEEKAYINGLALDKPRPHACDPGHSQLTLMYQEVTAENFMQQLLNRVDGKEAPFETHLEQKNDLQGLQRGLHDAKDPRLLRPPRNGIVGHLHACPEAPAKLRDATLQEENPSDDSLAESVTSQHFAVCSSLTRTLDSGIGTFPPPDYCSGMPCKSVPKLRPRLDPPPAGPFPARGPPPVTRVPRKARTLEREVPSTEDLLGPSKHQSMPAFHGVLTSAEPTSGHRDHRGCPEDLCNEPSKPRHTQQSKNWTFPNAKASAGTDPFLCSPHGLEGLHTSAMGSACSVAERRRTSSDGPQPSPAFSTSSSRTPSASDMGEEGSTEARSRDMGPEGQQGLENSESLSDSLYDSLSSCGSQG
ncbi:nck-associated protein 5-like isoform X1 [Varanus komodoensis]|uniref:nck-associated protein 5-like isoform X1 n=1 Tax=Varanus komodoensis TaxID=61221 RepID=UPI001CF7CBAF|nr:nck-associated protein 5-like isoform X1 [Varanus komodoensis]XP_044277814.1 nck-associated protein 5-like isoform X1 [Varanus komodoensis]XP_044277815.1 nck-associated protein 5-like isoform X1 [Varanus komodoensis]